MTGDLKFVSNVHQLDKLDGLLARAESPPPEFLRLGIINAVKEAAGLRVIEISTPDAPPANLNRFHYSCVELIRCYCPFPQVVHTPLSIPKIARNEACLQPPP
eukprot:CAMPEP_0119323012 /NCGR_PEP_ID=MMETSP1333-20130426/59734_1 /TAXON_ID=418940 /ORGANISM="Scyphosphaera apsteinii, Strain RCC1455" /LENGTH=102 /DNA_ID=CAMNT_0007330365 /DNA_START=48 /DNA_END=352 /DNA_ORIENTATION=+